MCNGFGVCPCCISVCIKKLLLFLAYCAVHLVVSSSLR
jgi:hypothetical protein